MANPGFFSYEVYAAPVMFEDERFLPAVGALVRDYLDRPRAAVISRLGDRTLSGVSNGSVVFNDPRWYAGRMVAPDSKHRRNKVANIKRELRDTGVLDECADSVFDVAIDVVKAVEIASTTGLSKTLIVAKQSDEIARADDHLTSLPAYTDRIIDTINRGLARHTSLRDYPFNALGNSVPIASLGMVSVSREGSVDGLVRNIAELVEEPLKASVAVGERGFTTALKVVD